MGSSSDFYSKFVGQFIGPFIGPPKIQKKNMQNSIYRSGLSVQFIGPIYRSSLSVQFVGAVYRSNLSVQFIGPSCQFDPLAWQLMWIRVFMHMFPIIWV